MRKYVLLGLSLLLSASMVYAGGMVYVSDLPQVIIPYADPLADDNAAIIPVVSPITIQLAELRPAAVIETENKTPEEQPAAEIKAPEGILQENENTPQQEDLTEKQAESPAENTTVNDEPETGEVIELDLGKGDLFVPKTEKKLIYSEKDKAGEVKDETYPSKKTLFSQENKPDEYKLNPNVSVKNTYFKSPEPAEKEMSENLVPLKTNDDNLRYKTTPTQFSAGEPAHNQGNYSLFKF